MREEGSDREGDDGWGGREIERENVGGVGGFFIFIFNIGVVLISPVGDASLKNCKI